MKKSSTLFYFNYNKYRPFMAANKHPVTFIFDYDSSEKYMMAEEL